MFRLVRLPLLTHCLEDNSKGVWGCMYIMCFGMYIFVCVCVCVCERGADVGRGNSKHFFFSKISVPHLGVFLKFFTLVCPSLSLPSSSQLLKMCLNTHSNSGRKETKRLMMMMKVSVCCQLVGYICNDTPCR